MQALHSGLPVGRSIHLRRLKHPLDENPCWEILGRLLIRLCAVLLSLPLLLVLVVLLPLCVVARWFLLFVHWNTQRSRYLVSGGLESMCGASARWLGGSWHSSILTGVLVFDSRLPASDAQALLTARVLPVTPRLARVPVVLPLSAGAGYCWLPDARFDIRRHVFDVDAGSGSVQDYLGRLVNADLSHEKSPWEVHCLHLGGNDPQTTLVLRIHQSLADGTTLVQLLGQVLADNKTPVQSSSHYSTHTLYYRYLRACLVGPITLLCWLLCSRSPPKLPPGPPSDKQYVISCSASVEMDKVVHIKQVTRSSVNSVLLSAISGAVRVLLQSSGIQQPADMKAVLPIDLYSQDSPISHLASRKSSIVISLPVSVEGGVPRLWKTRQIIKDVHKSSDPFVIYLASSALMSLVPSQYVRDALTKATENTATLKFSWLKGPDTPLQIGGRNLKAVYSLLPIQPGLGISVSVFIYSNTLYITSTTDQALGDVGGFLLHHLNAQIESLYELLKFRRNPSTKLDAITFYCFPDISSAPSIEVSRRMSEVQNEIEDLMESDLDLSREESERLHYLKSEFAYLLKELRKRKSSGGSKHSVFSQVLSDADLEDEEELCRPHRPRTMSCSFVSASRRSSLNNLLSKKRPVSLCMEPTSSLVNMGGARITDIARTHMPNITESSASSKNRNASSRCSGPPLSAEYIQLNCYAHPSESKPSPPPLSTTDQTPHLKQSTTSFNLQCKRNHFKKQKSDNNIIFYNGVSSAGRVNSTCKSSAGCNCLSKGISNKCLNKDHIGCNCCVHNSNHCLNKCVHGSNTCVNKACVNSSHNCLNKACGKSSDNCLNKGTASVSSTNCLKGCANNAGCKGCANNNCSTRGFVSSRGCGSVNSLIRSYSSLSKISSSSHCAGSPGFSQHYGAAYEDCQLTQVTLTQ